MLFNDLEGTKAGRARAVGRREPIEIAGKETAPEPLGNAVCKTRRRAPLVGTQDPAQALLAQVVGPVGLAQHGELAPAALAIRLELRRLVVDDVLVLDRDRRHVQTQQPSTLPGVVTGRQHQMLRGDIAFAGADPPLTDRKSTRLNSSHSQISYAVFC